MAVKWTEDQQKVISVRNKNLLVSAAAGSGKTAVLVERILSLITDKTYPVDVDRLLIVTFTKAAASEMRERLIKAIETRLESDPENEHLQRQTVLVHNAQISTIHGFCTFVIRNYFHSIQLDPSWRAGEEGEMKLLSEEALSEILEEAYEASTPEFDLLMECYGGTKDDRNVEDLIRKLSEYALSHPWPAEWLDSLSEPYAIPTLEELEQSRWFSTDFWEMVEKKVDGIRSITSQMAGFSRGNVGVGFYIDAVESDCAQMETLAEKVKLRDYEALRTYAYGISFVTLSKKKGKEDDKAAKEKVKVLRDSLKKAVDELKKEWLFFEKEDLLSDLTAMGKPVTVLLELTKAYMERFAKKKKEKNLIDFSDMEHLALSILVRREEGETIRTAAAIELSEQFEAVFIDEYQDSNDVQELLLRSVSKVDDGLPNQFMVGDVKQSIYSFRMAKPGLFMEKYHTYSTTEEGSFGRIDLKQNFRSRALVLESVNSFFEQLMEKDLGQITYDADAALYPGASYPETEGTETEILLVLSDEEGSEDLDEDRIELEALAVAVRIRELLNGGLVTDKETGELRPVRPSDIVILLRTVTNWGDTFYRVLQGQGIPAYRTSSTGYFSSMEVRTVLAFLSVCDNPDQDIPLASVMHSPIGGFTSEELTRIRIQAKENTFWRAVRDFSAECGEEVPLKEKTDRFLSLIREIRDCVFYMPIHRLLQMIYDRTGFYDYASSMPGGAQRKANLDMLLIRASEFERSSFAGLYPFIQYIEGLKKYEQDFGEVSTLGEKDEVVRIMSIHKSKGLEFPVVFVSGMGKQFNRMDQTRSVLVHQDLGIGADCVYPERHIKSPTLLKKIIKERMEEELLGEELRILYVAMTRAKEKLILTGICADLDKKLEKVDFYRLIEAKALPYYVRKGVKTYLEWILAAMARRNEFFPLLEERIGAEKLPAGVQKTLFHVETVTPLELLGKAVQTELTDQMNREALLLEGEGMDLSGETAKRMDALADWNYPHLVTEGLPAKVTVSDIKKQSMENEDGLEHFPKETQTGSYIPEFLRETEKVELKGSLRGTVYHKVMELLSFGDSYDTGALEEELRILMRKGHLNSEEKACIRTEDLSKMLGSDLGQRMIRAQKNGTLYREQPFMIRENASVLNPDFEGEEVLVQGIIDGYFEEDGKLILMDYKTDYCDDDGTILVRRYKEQLNQYRKALEQLTKKDVSEMWIYSFKLHKMLPIQ